MVLLGDQRGPSPGDRTTISQERRYSLRRAGLFMLAKRYCRGHALSSFLDDSTELMPGQAQLGTSAISLDRELVVNPSFRYEPRGEPPPEIRHRPPPMDGLLRGFPLAWTEAPGPGMWTPRWVRGDWLQILESLRPGQPAPGTLAPNVRHTLAMANVLVAPDHERSQRERWQTTYRDAGAQFR